MTLGEALATGIETLEQNLVSAARLTGEVLLAHSLGVDRTYIYSHNNDTIDKRVWDNYRSMLDRRLTGEPTQHITGIQEFYGRPFSVNERVLIPRPETEFVIEVVARLNHWEAPRIIDVGTGSGCIAITLSLEIPSSEVFAGDISEEALHVASRNSLALGASVGFLNMNLTDACTGQFEFVVSNPPYVDTNDFRSLQREVREHEPHVALFAPDEPTSVYRNLLPQAHERLIQGGYLVVEIGYAMEKQIRDLFGEEWELMATRADLQGIPRVIAARKR